MNTRQRIDDQENPGWDKRALTLGAIFSLLLILLMVPVNINRLYDEYMAIADPVLFIALGLAFVVFAPILSALSKRKRLLWGYLPSGAILLSLLIATLLNALNGDRHALASAWEGYAYDSPWLASLLIVPLITAGPVCIYRWCGDMDRRRELAKAKKSAQADREGVWPPPPVDQGSGQ